MAFTQNGSTPNTGTNGYTTAELTADPGLTWACHSQAMSTGNAGIVVTPCNSESATSGTADRMYTITGCVAGTTTCTAPDNTNGLYGTLGSELVSTLGSTFAPGCGTNGASTSTPLTVTPCQTENAPYSLQGGCELACTVPADTTGYDTTNASGGMGPSAWTFTGVTCASTHVGTATATACSSAGQDYSLSGCNAKCVAPTTTTGYVGSETGDADMDNFTVTGYTCDTGYSGTAAATACDAYGGEYTLSGCNANCVAPATLPEGYVNSAITETDLDKDNFDVTGYTCTASYGGTAVAAACAAYGGEYQLSGCAPLVKWWTQALVICVGVVFLGVFLKGVMTIVERH